MGRLDGKVAVITGATSGIGLRTAEVFVAEGAKVVIAGRRVAEGEELAKKLGASCVFRQTDVTIEEQMRALIALSVERFGRIDCLFNNAGGPAQTGGIEGLEAARFDAAMATLVRSVMLGMKHAAPYMKKQGFGSIINNGTSNASTAFTRGHYACLDTANGIQYVKDSASACAIGTKVGIIIKTETSANAHVIQISLN